MSSSDLLVTIVTHRTVSAPTTHSLEQLRIHQNELGFRWNLNLLAGDALICRGRSQACTKFLKETDIPFMLFIDDDILFSYEDVKKIYCHLASGKYDCIGGIYPVRGATQLSSYGWKGILNVDDKVNEIEYLATGFMGISRRLLDKILTELKLPDLNFNDWSRCYPFFEAGRCLDRPIGDPIYISEDWDFCEKVRKVGLKVYADTSVKLGHLREQVFTPQDVLQNQTKTAFDQQMYGEANKQMELMRSVDTDLSEFLHIPVTKVQEKMKNAQKQLAENFTKNPNNFYENNTEYLFDLALFNAQQSYFQDRLSQLLNIRGIKVLDIGCGIGTTVFFMAGQGNEVTGWDVNRQAINFANFKKKKYSLEGNITADKPDYSQYDLITAIDVLEHIDDLHGFLLELGSKMKPGAKFYHSDYFPKDGVWLMHHEENAEHLSSWLKEAKFTEWDNRWCIKGN